MEREIFLSYGGGVQSFAILVLISEGKLPKPSLIGMCLTSRERRLSLEYTKRYAVPLAESLGIEFVFIDHALSYVDLYSHKGILLIPAFTETGKFPTYCSSEWKKNVSRRYLRSRGFGPERPIVDWFGMSLDEVDRMRISDVQWETNHYPLIFDVPLRRHECILTIERAGYPKPYKSACWCCPNLNNEEWAEEKELTPDDFLRAVSLESEINEQDIASGHNGVWLHESRVPLDKADFSAKQPAQDLLCAATCWI